MTVAAVEQYHVWTVEEAAAYLRIGRTKAYAMARDGRLPAFRVGAQVRVERAALMAWIREQAAGVPS
jgi:excisionase family DNA binding protein